MQRVVKNRQLRCVPIMLPSCTISYRTALFALSSYIYFELLDEYYFFYERAMNDDHTFDINDVDALRWC